MPSHKSLRGISHNFSHSFISMMNYINDDYFLGHLLKQARLTRSSRLTVDLLRKTATPSDLLSNSVVTSIENYIKWFPELVIDSGSTMDFISSAGLTVEFDLEKTRPYSIHKDIFESPFICEMTIIDDRGKEYKHQHVGWWYPES